MQRTTKIKEIEMEATGREDRSLPILYIRNKYGISFEELITVFEDDLVNVYINNEESIITWLPQKDRIDYLS